VPMMHLQKPVILLLLKVIPMTNKLSRLKWFFHSLFLFIFWFLRSHLVENMKITLVIIMDRVVHIKLCFIIVEDRVDWNLPFLNIKVHLNI
jgi:hypothetical protein